MAKPKVSKITSSDRRVMLLLVRAAMRFRGQLPKATSEEATHEQRASIWSTENLTMKRRIAIMNDLGVRGWITEGPHSRLTDEGIAWLHETRLRAGAIGVPPAGHTP